MARTAAASELGPFLRHLRAEARLSLREVEARSGSPPSRIGYDYLCRVEQGRIVPSTQKLVTLSRIYDIPIQRLLDHIELPRLAGASPRSDDPAECRRIGVECLHRGDASGAYASFRRGLTLLEKDRSLPAQERAEMISRMRNNVAVSLMKLGKYRLAQQHAEAALENRTASPASTSRSLSILSSVAYQKNRLPLAEALAAAGLRLAEAERDEEQIAVCRQALGNALFDMDRHPEAEALYRAILADSVNPSGSHEAVVAAINLANTLREMDRPDEAEAAYRAASDLTDAHGNQALRSRVRRDLGILLRLQDRLEEAERSLREALEIALAEECRPEAFHAGYHLWCVLVRRGIEEEARATFLMLKRLRLGLDQKSEEVREFDAWLERLRARRRGRQEAMRREATP